MPIYEFECPACQHRFEELLRSPSAAADVRCPSCGARKVQRQPSVFAAHAASAPQPQPRGGCGRCGDPNGSCPMMD
ncbi:MAG: zinc ribbon domain-containing protein [Phycisphaerales bacterium]|nr:zinc ribbon domain-containing protein [Phycisphaerales bacterium]